MNQVQPDQSENGSEREAVGRIDINDVSPRQAPLVEQPAQLQDQMAAVEAPYQDAQEDEGGDEESDDVVDDVEASIIVDSILLKMNESRRQVEREWRERVTKVAPVMPPATHGGASRALLSSIDLRKKKIVFQ